MTEVNTISVEEATAVARLRMNTTTLDIPKDFDRWSPDEMSDWLEQTEDDPDVSDTDFYEAQQTVHRVLGVEDA
ncbi:hypothetical protein [Streptomyces endophyticus]|jgi:hypothetical protein|uniref:Uncharacterized protein n=1 Tax=Streptomyces endophyticus TaxID=714166 RepID=A0ABU6F4J6_9ACTN|nr:hypothetical protein [Streptomyces endophyticus]MEB8338325.1 hypothetical protein [Streptomyces endophyticus]